MPAIALRAEPLASKPHRTHAAVSASEQARSPLSTPIDEAERLILAGNKQVPRLARTEDGEAVSSAVKQVYNSTEVEVPSNKAVRAGADYRHSGSAA